MSEWICDQCARVFDDELDEARTCDVCGLTLCYRHIGKDGHNCDDLEG